MLRDSESSIRRACQRRYSAWTLYARAFAGNRADADDIVRQAVNRTLKLSDDLGSERQAHERVLAAIRTEALQLLERRRSPRVAGLSDEDERGGGDATDVGRAAVSAQPSVLEMLTATNSKTDPRHVAEVASEMLQELPRKQRRAIEMLLLRRPSVSLHDVARKRHMEIESVSEEIEEGLDLVAAALHAVAPRRYAGGHPDLKTLTGYVDGALTGDEARAIVEHGTECSECGDRLGTMMLLRARAAKATLAPRVPRGVRAAALVVTLAAGLVGGAFLAQAMAPNPWAEHATVDTVPRWFHDFLYGYRENSSTRDRDLIAGLDLLVRGELAEAIALLEPLAQEPAGEPEAAAYLGIAMYLSGDVSGRTVDFLASGTASTRAGRISDWYLANAHLARGNIDAARRRLRGLAFVGDWVGRQSQSLLDRLARAEPANQVIIG